jgi:hypothetical protein
MLGRENSEILDRTFAVEYLLGHLHVMSLTREESRNELLKLGLPSAVLAIFDGQLPHQTLWFRCRDPHYIFSTPVEPGGLHITPLWECGISVTAYQHSLPRGRFIEFSLENEEVAVIGSSFQSLAAALLIQLWEDDEPYQDLEEIGHLLEFRHLDMLLGKLREFESKPRSERADYDAWCARFIESCKGTV